MIFQSFLRSSYNCQSQDRLASNRPKTLNPWIFINFNTSLKIFVSEYWITKVTGSLIQFYFQGILRINVINIQVSNKYVYGLSTMHQELQWIVVHVPNRQRSGASDTRNHINYYNIFINDKRFQLFRLVVFVLP